MRRSRHWRLSEEFDLGDVEPKSVFGGVVDLESLGQDEGLAACEGIVERGDAVDVEVVYDQHRGLGVGVEEPKLETEAHA